MGDDGDWFWGKSRGGGGAPLRDNRGSVVTNLRLVHHGSVEVDHTPSPTKGGGRGDYDDDDYDGHGGYNRRGVPGLERHYDDDEGGGGGGRRRGGGGRGGGGGGKSNHASPITKGGPKKFMSALAELVSSEDPRDRAEKHQRELGYQAMLKEQIEEKRRKKEAEEEKEEETKRRELEEYLLAHYNGKIPPGAMPKRKKKGGKSTRVKSEDAWQDPINNPSMHRHDDPGSPRSRVDAVWDKSKELKSSVFGGGVSDRVYQSPGSGHNSGYNSDRDDDYGRRAANTPPQRRRGSPPPRDERRYGGGRGGGYRGGSREDSRNGRGGGGGRLDSRDGYREGGGGGSNRRSWEREEREREERERGHRGGGGRGGRGGALGGHDRDYDGRDAGRNEDAVQGRRRNGRRDDNIDHEPEPYNSPPRGNAGRGGGGGSDKNFVSAVEYDELQNLCEKLMDQQSELQNEIRAQQAQIEDMKCDFEAAGPRGGSARRGGANVVGKAGVGGKVAPPHGGKKGWGMGGRGPGLSKSKAEAYARDQSEDGPLGANPRRSQSAKRREPVKKTAFGGALPKEVPPTRPKSTNPPRRGPPVPGPRPGPKPRLKPSVTFERQGGDANPPRSTRETRGSPGMENIRVEPSLAGMKGKALGGGGSGGFNALRAKAAAGPVMVTYEEDVETAPRVARGSPQRGGGGSGRGGPQFGDMSDDMGPSNDQLDRLLLQAKKARAG
jgi:hypothetical protein